LCPIAIVLLPLRPSLQIYADRATLEFFRRPSPLADMKQMYEQQYRQADYTRLRHSDTKIIGIYDDHDYGSRRRMRRSDWVAGGE